MVTRDFDAMLAERAGVRPTFKIGGQEFTMKAKLPQKKYFAMRYFMADDNTSEEDAYRKLFETVLVKDDRDRFFEMLNSETDDEDDESVIDITQLDALGMWILEFYSGKAEASTNSSSAGTNGTGPQRNVVSLNPRVS